MWNVHAVAVLTFCLALIYEINACNETVDIFPCACAVIDGKIAVDCSGNHLRTVPEFLPKRMSTLDFSDNLLQPDTIDSLCIYDHLEHVSIANNHLMSMEHKQLTKCQITKSLVLSGNPFNIVDKYTLYGLEFTLSILGYEAREFRENTFSDMFGLNTLDMLTHQNRIPSNLFKNNRIKELKMNINGATEIPKDLISPLNNTLRKLTVKSHSLQNIPSELLSHLKTLEMFSLQVNGMHSLPSTLFQKEHHEFNLTIQNISLSGIKSLPSFLILHLAHLRHLEIHGTLDLPSNLFFGLLELESLDLSECSITAIPDDLFYNLRHLQTLNLHNVGLTVIKKEDFKHLESLKKLDLSNNNFRSLDQKLFHYISDSVKFINISKNRLKRVPNNLFKQNAVLERLDISKNQIYSVENEAFVHLADLKHLHLQSNKLDKIHAATFVYNVNMTYLDISSNILIDLPVSLLDSTRSLLVFNLSDNRISNLERSITLYAPTLRELNLAYNPIQCDCGIKTVKKLLPNALIIGDCDNTQLGIAIVDFPDVNCSAKNDEVSLITSSVSATKQLRPTGNQTKWGSKVIISSNDPVPTVTLNSILPTATRESMSYPENEENKWINSTLSKKSSETIKLNVLPVTKYNNVSESEASVSISSNFTRTPVYDQSNIAIKKLTSVSVNEVRLDSDDNTSEIDVNASIIPTDHLSTVSIKFTKTVESVIYKTDIASATAIINEKSSAIALKPEPEINKRTSADVPDVTLEPSFKDPNSTSYRDYHFTGHLSETLHTKSFLSGYDSDTSDFVGIISPSGTRKIDDQTMTDGLQNPSETFKYSPNATALPPDIGYANITSSQETDDTEQQSDYFYLSLGSIISVAVFSVLILVILYVKRRRSGEFIIGTRKSANIYEIEDSFNEDDLLSPRESACPMKEVPSIQIETVDDDGNVKLEYYTEPKDPLANEM